VPVELQRIVQRCLRKDPARRFQHMDDVGIALQDLEEDLKVGLGAIPEVAPASYLQRRFWQIAVLLVAAALAGTAISVWLSQDGTDSNPAYRLVPVANDAAAEFEPAWSPDGRSLAYIAEEGGKFQIFARALSASTPVQLTAA